MGESNSLQGPYSLQKAKVGSSKFESLEGPEYLITRNKSYLYFDTYDTSLKGITTFHGIHNVVNKTNDSQNQWGHINKVQSPMVTRHGQFILNK